MEPIHLAIEVTPPHGGLPLHVHHQEDEAMYILEGEYEIQCGDQAFRATARQVPLHHVSWRIRKARGENELTDERRPAGYAESQGKLPASTGLNLFLQVIVRLRGRLRTQPHDGC